VFVWEHMLFVATSCDIESVFKLLSLYCVKGDLLVSVYISLIGYHKNSPVLHTHFLMNKKTISHAKHSLTLKTAPISSIPLGGWEKANYGSR